MALFCLSECSSVVPLHFLVVVQFYNNNNNTRSLIDRDSGTVDNNSRDTMWIIPNPTHESQTNQFVRLNHENTIKLMLFTYNIDII